MYIHVYRYISNTYEVELLHICLEDKYDAKDEVTTKSCLRP